MARFSMGYTTRTMVAYGDSPTDLADGNYAGYLQGGGATQQLKINEVYIGGEDTASTPTTMVLGRDVQPATATFGQSGVFLAYLDGTATVPGTLPTYGNTASGNKPRRSTTAGRVLGLSLNTYGGIARWQARYGEEITVYGTAATVGEVSLSSVTGTGKISGHVLFEAV